MKKTVHYDPQIAKDYEDKRKMLRDAQQMALKMMEDDPSPSREMSVVPGNRKYLSSEWEKTHGEADDIRQKMGDYTLDGEPNLKAREKTSNLYRSASKRLDPLSEELDMQQKSADNENEQKMRIKQEALRRILSGISE